MVPNSHRFARGFDDFQAFKKRYQVPRITLLVTLCLVALVFEPSKTEASIIVRMDDLPFQPVNGLVHPSGVTFGFTVGGIASLDANYASGGPGSTTFISDPSIEGSAAGVLRVNFPGTFNQIQFGLAVSSNIPSFVDVELFDTSNVSLGVTALSLTPMPTFAENRFSYLGTGISRFSLNLTPSANAGRFAFDNLFLDNVPVNTVPEPTSLVVFLLGSCLYVARANRYRPRQGSL